MNVSTLDAAQLTEIFGGKDVNFAQQMHKEYGFTALAVVSTDHASHFDYQPARLNVTVDNGVIIEAYSG